MNVFVLSACPVAAAQFLNDKHVVKMCLESAQILCTVHHHYGLDAPYRATHRNHPCVLWAIASFGNYTWLRRHGAAIGQEYTYRYGKVHKSAIVIDALPMLDANVFPVQAMTSFAQAMPEQYRHADHVMAYQLYYRGEKDFGWNKGRPRPEWMEIDT